MGQLDACLCMGQERPLAHAPYGLHLTWGAGQVVPLVVRCMQAHGMGKRRRTHADTGGAAQQRPAAAPAAPTTSRTIFEWVQLPDEERLKLNRMTSVGRSHVKAAVAALLAAGLKPSQPPLRVPFSINGGALAGHASLRLKGTASSALSVYLYGIWKALVPFAGGELSAVYDPPPVCFLRLQAKTKAEVIVEVWGG